MQIEGVAGELTRLGPSETHRERVHRTWFGTLLGESVVLMGLLLLYIVGLGLIWKTIGEDLSDLRAAIGETAFWAVMAAPLAFILVFSGLPTAVRARNEHRLRPLADNPKGAAPGYFRLHPYDRAGADGYVARTDLRDTFVAGMFGNAGSIHYLSGASGVGKSSLIAAEIGPAVEANGWKVLDARGVGDSYASIAATVAEVEGMLDLPNPVSDASDAGTAQAHADLKRQLTICSEKLAEQGKADGLLIVVDQFEEFLILEDAAKRAPFADLLRRFAEEPVARVKLLMVFRADYRPLLFKQGLPDYVSGNNSFEIAPFARSEAEAFLKGGPKLLDDAGYDALFRGLDRVEETRGLYRPITLNIVGLVLSRTGARLADKPDLLIERYLRDCLANGHSRDFVKPVLEAMITPAGTKEPRTADEIARSTGLMPWQVQATLVELQHDGLVRPLARDGLWEVSHDFLARLLSGMLGRLKRPALRRAAPWAIGIGLTGWAGFLALALPLYLSREREEALGEIRTLGFTRMAGVSEGYSFRAENTVGTADLLKLTVAAEKGRFASDISALDLAENTRVHDLGPLADLAQLTTLDLSGTRMHDLGPLADLGQLTTLDLSTTPVDNLGPLADLAQLTTLDLSGTRVHDLGPLADLGQLTTLDLTTPRWTTSALSPTSGSSPRSACLAPRWTTSALSPTSGSSPRSTCLAPRWTTSAHSPTSGSSPHST